MPPGTPNLFREDASRNLNRIFPPVRGGFELPQVLGGVVNLTHDYLGTLPYAAVSIYEVIGSIDVISITTAIPVPEGYCWIIDEGHIFTDDTASRVLRLFLNVINSVSTWSIAIMRQDSGTTGENWPIARRFIAPPQSQIELNVPALTAGKKLRFRLMYLQVPLGQFCPKT